MPEISIITPRYNCDHYISETIYGIQPQTFTDWEHIVVDDGSTDGSVTIIHDLAKKDKC